jgi:DDE superfamily endonuclease
MAAPQQEGETSFWSSTKAGRQETEMDLRTGDAEESAATQICICAVDARDGGTNHQGQIQDCPERDVRGPAVGAVGYHLSKTLHRALERDEALVQRWLKTEYPKIKKMAQMQGADIYFGDAAHMRSDHHAGRTWGKKGETPVVETTGARHGISLISAITSKGHMRFMIKESGGVNADVFIEFLRRLLIGAKRKIFLIVGRGQAQGLC